MTAHGRVECEHGYLISQCRCMQHGSITSMTTGPCSQVPDHPVVEEANVFKSEWQYALQATTTTNRNLMCRLAMPDGKDSKGDEVPWKVIAKFDSYIDAERVLKVLQAHGK